MTSDRLYASCWLYFRFQYVYGCTSAFLWPGLYSVGTTSVECRAVSELYHYYSMEWNLASTWDIWQLKVWFLPALRHRRVMQSFCFLKSLVAWTEIWFVVPHVLTTALLAGGEVTPDWFEKLCLIGLWIYKCPVWFTKKFWVFDLDTLTTRILACSLRSFRSEHFPEFSFSCDFIGSSSLWSCFCLARILGFLLVSRRGASDAELV